ncbi:MAG: ComF family protein [Bacteroidetes bacterium]|uniref:ComF family protein n=1 Tax=Candidatus Cryptobacteroides merdavium TaxID=2840769 RepID=A0A9D9EBX5_9BACT|nr:ComF family protein [Candidatus Cryptobacteroides merdavium]
MYRFRKHISTASPFFKEILTGISGTLSAAGDIILPRYCAVCGRRLLIHEKFICIYCLADFPYTYNWTIPHNRMADKFNEMIQRDIIDSNGSGMPMRGGIWTEPTENCTGKDGTGKDTTGKDQTESGTCKMKTVHEPYAYAAALFLYRGESAYRRIPHRLKYHGDISIGRHFGKMLAKRLAGTEHFSNVDMVIPVPLHWRRRWERGYNQAAVIAAETAAVLGTALREDILVRHRRTRTQTRLDVLGKIQNVRQAFGIREKFLASPPAARHILLVDDVFTTGATINACFRALRTVYSTEVRISAVTLAFVDSG